MPEVSDAEIPSLAPGKNFSRNNVAGTRKASDLYETPFSLTRQFLRERPIGKAMSVLEPAAGHGAITRVLNEEGYHYVTSYDLVADDTDFLAETGEYDIVMTNPPYSLAHQFIQKAKQVATRKIIFLLPLSYLHGKKRFDDIFSDREFPLAEVWVFTRYAMLGDPLREDGKYRTGMVVYAWYVWEYGHRGAPTIHWLDNHSYVIGARA